MLFGLLKERCHCGMYFSEGEAGSLKIEIYTKWGVSHIWSKSSSGWYCSSRCALNEVLAERDRDFEIASSHGGTKPEIRVRVLQGKYIPQSFRINVNGKLIGITKDINGKTIKDADGYPLNDSEESRRWLRQYYNEDEAYLLYN